MGERTEHGRMRYETRQSERESRIISWRRDPSAQSGPLPPLPLMMSLGARVARWEMHGRQKRGSKSDTSTHFVSSHFVYSERAMQHRTKDEGRRCTVIM